LRSGGIRREGHYISKDKKAKEGGEKTKGVDIATEIARPLYVSGTEGEKNENKVEGAG